jgi:hypothetical protein
MEIKMKPNDRVIVDDGRQRFWVTIKKIVGDKVKAIDDRTNRMIEIPRSSIIASRCPARLERIARRELRAQIVPANLKFMTQNGFTYWGEENGEHRFSIRKFVTRGGGITHSCSVSVNDKGAWHGGGFDPKFPRTQGTDLKSLESYARSVKRKIDSL